MALSKISMVNFTSLPTMTDLITYMAAMSAGVKNFLTGPSLSTEMEDKESYLPILVWMVKKGQ